MLLHFANNEDIKARLRHTIILYKKKPIYVLDTDGDGLLCRYLSTDRRFRVEARDLKLDMSSVPLGNLNTKWGVAYLSRVPIRRYKQGLSFDNLHAIKSFRESLRYLHHFKDLNMTILGKYPSLKRAKESVDERNIHVAFSRTLSLGRNDCLFYKGQHIGWYDTKTFLFRRDYSFMKEYVEGGNYDD